MALSRKKKPDLRPGEKVVSRGRRLRCYPNQKQINLFEKYFYATRFLWNSLLKLNEINYQHYLLRKDCSNLYRKITEKQKIRQEIILPKTEEQRVKDKDKVLIVDSEGYILDKAGNRIPERYFFSAEEASIQYTEFRNWLLLPENSNDPENAYLEVFKTMPRCLLDTVLVNLVTAMKRFFDKKSGFPKYKSYKHKQSCTFNLNDRHKGKIRAWENQIARSKNSEVSEKSPIDRYPIINDDLGPMLTKFSYGDIPFPKSVTITKTCSGEYYLSCVEEDVRVVKETTAQMVEAMFLDVLNKAKAQLANENKVERVVGQKQEKSFDDLSQNQNSVNSKPVFNQPDLTEALTKLGLTETDLKLHASLKRELVRSTKIVGFDLGVKENNFMVGSDGSIFSNPKFFKGHEHQIKRLQQGLKRKKPGSQNYRKSSKKLAKAHAMVGNQREDYAQQLTTPLVANMLADIVCEEDLNIAGMKQGNNMGKTFSDAGLGNLKRILNYKAAAAGKLVLKAPRFYPSSKTCFNTNFVNYGLRRNEEEWFCPSCKEIHFRDRNAANNIAWEAVKNYLLDEDRLAELGRKINPELCKLLTLDNEISKKMIEVSKPYHEVYLAQEKVRKATEPKKTYSDKFKKPRVCRSEKMRLAATAAGAQKSTANFKVDLNLVNDVFEEDFKPAKLGRKKRRQWSFSRMQPQANVPAAASLIKWVEESCKFSGNEFSETTEVPQVRRSKLSKFRRSGFASQVLRVKAVKPDSAAGKAVKCSKAKEKNVKCSVEAKSSLVGFLGTSEARKVKDRVRVAKNSQAQQGC